MAELRSGDLRDLQGLDRAPSDLAAPKFLAILASPLMPLLIAPAMPRDRPSQAESPGHGRQPQEEAQGEDPRRIIAKAHPLKIPNSEFEAAGLARNPGLDGRRSFRCLLDFSRELPADPEKLGPSRAPNAAKPIARSTKCAVARWPRCRSMPNGARAFFEQNFRPDHAHRGRREGRLLHRLLRAGGGGLALPRATSTPCRSTAGRPIS